MKRSPNDKYSYNIDVVVSGGARWLPNGFEVQDMKRYKALVDLIHIFKPRSIIEVGVWNGENGVRMINAAAQHHGLKNISYIGYDLFEFANAETDAREFNVKKVPHHKEVKHSMSTQCPGADITLVVGDTNVSLKPIRADFVFIDGGHSVQTAANDLSKVMRSKIIVLDDYYTMDESGACPDTSKYGVNEVIKDKKHIV